MENKNENRHYFWLLYLRQVQVKPQVCIPRLWILNFYLVCPHWVPPPPMPFSFLMYQEALFTEVILCHRADLLRVTGDKLCGCVMVRGCDWNSTQPHSCFPCAVQLCFSFSKIELLFFHWGLGRRKRDHGIFLYFGWKVDSAIWRCHEIGGQLLFEITCQIKDNSLTSLFSCSYYVHCFAMLSEVIPLPR